jgi:hypothetical protein
MVNLFVVVDPDYGDRLEAQVQGAPVWVVSTERNKAVCERLWKNHPRTDHREQGAITSYAILNSEDRLGNLLNILPELETHHGEYEDQGPVFAKGFVLEVIGLAFSDDAIAQLREFGFTSFTATAEGFQACK